MEKVARASLDSLNRHVGRAFPTSSTEKFLTVLEEESSKRGHRLFQVRVFALTRNFRANKATTIHAECCPARP